VSLQAQNRLRTDLDNIPVSKFSFKQTTYASSAIGAIVSFLGITKKRLFALPKKFHFGHGNTLSAITINYITTIARIKKCLKK